MKKQNILTLSQRRALCKKNQEWREEFEELREDNCNIHPYLQDMGFTQKMWDQVRSGMIDDRIPFTDKEGDLVCPLSLDGGPVYMKNGKVIEEPRQGDYALITGAQTIFRSGPRRWDWDTGVLPGTRIYIEELSRTSHLLMGRPGEAPDDPHSPGYITTGIAGAIALWFSSQPSIEKRRWPVWASPEDAMFPDVVHTAVVEVGDRINFIVYPSVTSYNNPLKQIRPSLEGTRSDCLRKKEETSK